VKSCVLVLVTLMASACGGAATAAVKPTPTPVRPALSSATDPKLGQILVDAKGFTLYFFVPEQGTKIVCTGDCVTTWRPLMATGTTPPTSTAPLPGVIASVDRPDGGRQVTYDGWPLYTFAMDTSPGDTQGSGASGEWFVALAAASESTPTPTPPPTPPPTPVPTAPPATAPPPPPPPPTMAPPPPFGNDGDADNRGGPNDGDGNK
jgi:predicted lipoprotein with Yx(FWY)xxD motif